MNVNVVLAARTGYIKSVLGMKEWAAVLSAVMILLGVIPRLKLVKIEGIWKRAE